MGYNFYLFDSGRLPCCYYNFGTNLRLLSSSDENISLSYRRGGSAVGIVFRADGWRTVRLLVNPPAYRMLSTRSS